MASSCIHLSPLVTITLCSVAEHLMSLQVCVCARMCLSVLILRVHI